MFPEKSKSLLFLFLFTISYILGVKKHTLFNKFLSQKRQQICQEERDVGYEGRKGAFFVRYTLDIYHSLNSIIH